MNVVEPAITHNNNLIFWSAVFFNKTDYLFNELECVGWTLALRKQRMKVDA